MAKVWEIRGLFGNEYALEGAMEELKKHQGLGFEKLDRRNLSVRLSKRNAETEGIVRRTFDIFHGFVESEAPLGVFDKKMAEAKQKKLKAIEEKRKKAQH